MKIQVKTERDIESLAAFVHGVLAGLHALGMVYNIKRRNWFDVAAHSATMCGLPREGQSNFISLTCDIPSSLRWFVGTKSDQQPQRIGRFLPTPPRALGSTQSTRRDRTQIGIADLQNAEVRPKLRRHWPTPLR